MAITSRENAGRASLDEWVDEVRRVYGRKDQNRSMYDIWLHATRHAAMVGEEVRRDRPYQILDELSHFVLWLLTFVGRARAPLGERPRGQRAPEEALFRLRCAYSDLVWNKYPNRCPVCFDQTNEDVSGPVRCTCLLTPVEVIEGRHMAETDEQKLKKDEDKRRKSAAIRGYARGHLHAKPNTINEFQHMFGAIYRCNIERETLQAIAFHLLEEVGEVADALIGIYTYKTPLAEIKPAILDWRLMQLEDEIADITSWVFALVIKLDYLRKDTSIYVSSVVRQNDVGPAIMQPFELGRIVWSSYGSDEQKKLWCAHCKSESCRCGITFLTKPKDVAAVVNGLRARS